MKWIQVVQMISSLISNNLKSLFVTAFLVFAGLVSANTQTVKIEVEGMGESLQSAIDRGLTEAMGRVNGRSIESEILSKTSEQINNKEYLIKKLSTENKELYGSVKPTEIAKLILEKDKVNIKPSMIQPINEIKSIGKFKVNSILHSEIDSEITINVISAETIQ